MEFQFLDEVYEDENGKKLFDVKVGNETLKGFEAVKRNTAKCNKCDYRYNCNQGTVFRKYDCVRNTDKLEKVFKELTLFMVATWAYYVFSHFQFVFLYKMSILLLSLTGFDIVCTLVEESVPKIYNWCFSLKVRKKLKIQRKKKKAEEAKAKAEEEARFKDVPNYQEIKNARTMAQTFSEISKQYDYGSNTIKLKECVEDCEVIMQILDKSPSDYYRVSDVFELHLPRLCTTIELYQKAVEAKKITEHQDVMFDKFIDATLVYLDRKKNESIYYNNLDEINLKSSMDTLRQSLQEEDKQ